MITTNTRTTRAIEAVSRDQLQLLVRFQEMENDIANIRLQLSLLPDKLVELESLLTESRCAVDEKKAERDALSRVYRGCEADFETNQARIAKREAQLGEVKTNKEYQAVIKEIRDIREISSDIEDNILKCLDKIDAYDDVIAEKEKDFLSVQADVKLKKEKLNLQAQKLREQVDQIVKEADTIRAGLDENLLNQYKMIRKRSGGNAIVEICDSVCQGCHLNIPPQMYNELHDKDTVRICPHCYRLIYVELGS